MWDADVSEMSHNVVLEDELQQYVGVELNWFHFVPKDLNELNTLLSKATQREEVLTWEEMIQDMGGERWTRMCMGMIYPRLCVYKSIT